MRAPGKPGPGAEPKQLRAAPSGRPTLAGEVCQDRMTRGRGLSRCLRPPSCGTLRRKPGFRVDVTAEDREEGSSRAAESRSSQGRRWHRPRSAWLPLCREALGPVLPFPPLKRVDRHRDLLLTQTRARSPLPPPSPCAGFPSTLELPVSFRGPVPLAVVFIFSDENRMSCSRRSSDPTQRRRPRRSFF